MLNRNFAIALAVAMVLAVLYGCSSSGGIKDDRDMYKEDAEMLQGELNTANAEVMRLTGELTTETGRADGLQTNLDTANAEVMRIQGELDTANARVMELEGMLATANTNLDTANARVMELEGMLATANTNLGTANARVMELEGDLDTANDRVMELEGMLATANTNLGTANARIVELEDLLAAATGNAGNLQAMLDTANDRIAELEGELAALKRPAGDDEYPMVRALVKVIGPGAMEPARTVTVDKYEDSFTPEATGLDAASGGHAISGWQSAGLGDDTNTVALYSNIEGPGDEEYGMYYVAGSVGSSATGPGRVSVNSVVGDVLTFAATVASGDSELFGSSLFPTGVRQTNTYVDDVADTDVDESMGFPRTFDGTFHGVQGEFSCSSGGTCSITTNSDGDILTFVGMWEFDAEDVAAGADDHMIADVVPDDEYVAFGFWKEVDTDGNATGVTALWQGGDQVTGEDMDDIVGGDVTYSGDATGKYVRKTRTPDGQVSTLAGGQFTANVELTAHFGGLDVAESKKFKVDGTVTKFMDGADNIDSNWSVKLDTALITHMGGDDNSTFMGPTKAQGPVAGADGNWNGAFFGTTAIENDEDTTDVDESGFTQPAYAAGQFDAHFLNGHVRGAFGAEKD